MYFKPLANNLWNGVYLAGQDLDGQQATNKKYDDNVTIIALK